MNSYDKCKTEHVQHIATSLKATDHNKKTKQTTKKIKTNNQQLNK